MGDKVVHASTGASRLRDAGSVRPLFRPGDLVRILRDRQIEHLATRHRVERVDPLFVRGDAVDVTKMTVGHVRSKRRVEYARRR